MPGRHNGWEQHRWWWYDPITGDIVPIIQGGHNNPVIDQAHFSEVSDDGDTNAGTLGTEDANWNQDVDANFRVRFVMDETAGNDASNRTYQLQYNLASAGWNDVTDVSSVVRSAAGAGNEATATTQRLTDPTGNYTNGAYDETDGVTGSISLTGGDHTEIEYCVQIRSADVTDAQTLQLRVIMSGQQDAATYGATPTITVNESNVQTGDGASAGAATVTATGVNLFLGDGSSTGAATVTGDGEWIAKTDGASTGQATAAGTGAAIRYGDGGSTGQATTTGVGSQVSAGDGASTGTATTAATGINLFLGDGTGAGVATVAATGVNLFLTDGSAAGTVTVLATAVSVLPTDGTIAGLAAVSGMGQAVGGGGGSPPLPRLARLLFGMG